MPIVHITLLFHMFSSSLVLDILKDDFSLNPNKTKHREKFQIRKCSTGLYYVIKIINYKYRGRKTAFC